MCNMFGGFGYQIKHSNTKADQPEDNFEAVGSLKPGTFEFKDMLHVPKRFLNLKAVVVNTYYFVSAARKVIGQYVPEFTGSPGLW